MAREKPIPRSARKEINRGRIRSRDNDTVKQISVGLMDIDAAIMFYFNNTIQPMVEENGEGKVLVINHTGDKLCSMVGDQIAQKAFENNWRGIFVNGYIRDVEVIKNISIGVHAKNAYPMKTDKSVGVGTKDKNINIGSVSMSSGDWIYVDTNGWVVSRKKLEL